MKDRSQLPPRAIRDEDRGKPAQILLNMVATVYGGCDSRDSEPKAFRMVIEVVVASIGGFTVAKGGQQRKLGKVAIGRSDSWASNLCTKATVAEM